MKKINLAEPFEKLSRTISSLPFAHDGVSQGTKKNLETKMIQLLRQIYEAANGRQVATTIGLVAIAPPIVPHLRDKPFYVETQADFLSQAMARMADGISKRAPGIAAKFPRRSANCNRVARQSTRKHSSESRKCSCMRVG